MTSLGIATVLVSSFRQSSPGLHLQNRVHGNLLWLQLHLMFLHAEAPSQLHLIRVMVSSGANVTPSGTVVGSNVLEDSCLTYPCSTGSRAGQRRDSAAYQVPVWRWDLFTFSTKASVVGGSACILGAEVAVLPNFVVKILYLISDIVSLPTRLP